MKRFLTSFGLFGVLALSASTAGASVWTTQRPWTNQDELRFGEFIRTLPMNFLDKGTGAFSNIPTDCADAAYTLRIVFAYQNGLPFEASLSESKVTNETDRFDGVTDELQRVRKFINYVRNGTNTQTLIKDSYPLAIRRGVIRSGTMFLHPQGNEKVPLTYRAGHVYYIQAVGDNGIIRYVSSTVPAAVRSLNVRNGIVFSPMTEDGGYRAWRWPGVATQQNESLEQFKLAGWHPNSYRDGALWNRWSDEIIKRLAIRAPTPKESLDAVAENLQGLISERAKAVNEGWAFYNKKYKPGQCMNAEDYDGHSTPTRDVKIQIELQSFDVVANAYNNSTFHWIPAKALHELYESYRYQVAPNIVVDVNQLKNAFLSNHVLQISEPEHSPEVRWGLAEQGTWPCPDRRKAYHGADTVREN